MRPRFLWECLSSLSKNETENNFVCDYFFSVISVFAYQFTFLLFLFDVTLTILNLNIFSLSSLLLTFVNDTMTGRIGQIFKLYRMLIIHFHLNRSVWTCDFVVYNLQLFFWRFFLVFWWIFAKLQNRNKNWFSRSRVNRTGNMLRVVDDDEEQLRNYY